MPSPRRILKLAGPWRIALSLALSVLLTIGTAWWIALGSRVLPAFPFSRRPPHPNPTYADQPNPDSRYFTYPEAGRVQVIVVSDHGTTVKVGSTWYPPDEWEESMIRQSPERWREGDILPLWVGGLWRAYDEHPGFPLVWYSEFGAGWPMTSLVSRQARDGQGNNPWTGAWRPPQRWLNALGSGSAVLPLSPAMPGFIVNTLLFWVFVYPVLSVPAIVSGLRRRMTNRCLACGYSLDGIDAGPCPECSAATPPTPANTERAG